MSMCFSLGIPCALFSAFCLSPKRVGVWLFYKQGKHIFNGTSQVNRSVLSDPLLHQVALPQPSVTSHVGFKCGHMLMWTICPLLTICHRYRKSTHGIQSSDKGSIIQHKILIKLSKPSFYPFCLFNKDLLV